MTAEAMKREGGGLELSGSYVWIKTTSSQGSWTRLDWRGLSIGVNRCCTLKQPCFFLMSHRSPSKSRGPFRALLNDRGPAIFFGGQDGSSPVRVRITARMAALKSRCLRVKWKSGR